MPHSTPMGRAWAPQPFLPFGLKITSTQPPVPSASKPRPSSCSSGHQPYEGTAPPRLPGTPPPPPHPPAPVEDRARLPLWQKHGGDWTPSPTTGHSTQPPACHQQAFTPGSLAPAPLGTGLGPDFHNNQPQIFPSKGLERLLGSSPGRHLPSRPPPPPQREPRF